MIYLFSIQVAVSLVAFFGYSRESMSTYLFISLITIPLYAYITWDEMRRERWYMSPLTAYMGASLLYISLASYWAWLVDKKGIHGMFKTGDFWVEGEIQFAQGVAVLGVAFFYLGYKLSVTKVPLRAIRLAQSLSASYHFRLKHWIVLGVISYFSIFARPYIGSYDVLIRWMSLVPEALVVVIALSNYELEGDRIILHGSRRLLFWALIALLANISMIAFKASLRNPMLEAMFLFIWMLMLINDNQIRSSSPYQIYKSLRIPIIALTASTAIALFIVMPMGKQLLRAEYSDSAEFKKEVMSNLDIMSTFPSGGIWSLPARTASCSVSSLSTCIYFRGLFAPDRAPLTLVAVGVIPRIIWSDKPYVSRGAFFTSATLKNRTSSEKEATSSTAITPMGELYWSYGIFGVIAGMSAMGFMAGFTYEIFSYNMLLNPIRAVVSVGMVLSALRWYEASASENVVLILFFSVVCFPLTMVNIDRILNR